MTAPKEARYPIWSTKAILLISLPVIAITAVLVFWLSGRSVFVELQITLAIIAAGLLLFLTVGLYRGVRLEKPRTAAPDLSPDSALVSATVAEIPDFNLDLNLPKVEVDIPNVSDAGDDLIGFLLTIVLWVVISAAFVFLIWLVTQLLTLALPAVIVMLYWLFYRALRIVFSKSRACRGRLGLSLAYSVLYTVLYIGWLFAVVWVSQYVTLRWSS